MNTPTNKQKVEFGVCNELVTSGMLERWPECITC